MTKAIVRANDEAFMAEQLAAQYQKAISGTREILVFGAMMMQLGRVLELHNTVDESGRFTGRTGGVKQWIEANCPSINYNTAYGFYRLARGLVETLELPKTVDLHRLLLAEPESLSPRETKAKEKVESAISGKSARQLEFDFCIRKPLGKPGAPVGNQNAKKDLRGQDPDELRAAMKLRVDTETGKAMSVMAELIDGRDITVLGLTGMRFVAEELERLAAEIRKLIKETAEARKP